MENLKLFKKGQKTMKRVRKKGAISGGESVGANQWGRISGGESVGAKDTGLGHGLRPLDGSLAITPGENEVLDVLPL